MAANQDNAHEARKQRKREREATVRRENWEMVRARERAKEARYRKAHPEIVLARTQKWREAHRVEIREYARRYAAAHLAERNALRKITTQLPARRLRQSFQNAKDRARKRGIGFDPVVRDRFIADPPLECFCCRATLDYSLGTLGGGTGQTLAKRRAPSLDRFDNTKGYVVGNVHVICFRCNKLKSDASVEELESIVAYMRAGLATRT